MSEKKKHGGARAGGGRKSKAEEYKLIDELDKQRDPKMLIAKMFQHIDGGSEKMLEKYLAYRFGMPKQMIESTVKKVKEEFDLSKLSDKDLEAYEHIVNKASVDE
tara:strand:+ start:200 stop:514 length:315 start_codon:yes stop_codon:yes gene_type:complete